MTKNEEYAKRLRKFTKEQIIGALTAPRYMLHYLDIVLIDLESKEQAAILEEEMAASEAEHKATMDVLNWRNEMCKKYGSNGKVKLTDIPLEEVKKGATLEDKMGKARKRAEDATRKARKVLEY